MFQRIKFNTIILENNIYHSEEIKELTNKIEKGCNLIIECPYCNKKAEIFLSLSLFDDPRKILKMIIPTTSICEHSFTLYLDSSFNVRSYEKTDYTLKKENIKKLFK